MEISPEIETGVLCCNDNLDRLATVPDECVDLIYLNPPFFSNRFENRRASKRMVRWRTGCEGRISCAKRDFGLARTRQDGIRGTRTWCGHTIFAHNLLKIAALTG